MLVMVTIGGNAIPSVWVMIFFNAVAWCLLGIGLGLIFDVDDPFTWALIAGVIVAGFLIGTALVWLLIRR